nr:hypothetical protein [Tanacetum cinerariifolium]
ECEVTLEDKRECDELICENSSTIDVCDNHSKILFDSKNDDLSSDDESFEDIEYIDASVPDPAIVSVEEENERVINLVENDNSDSSNDHLLEEVDSFLDDNPIPPGIENFADDPEEDIRFLEELLIDDSIISHESSDSNFEDNPSIPQPPPKPPDAETDVGEEIAVVMNDKDKFDDDYQIFMFDKVFSLLFTESEDTIFDPGISD